MKFKRLICCLTASIFITAGCTITETGQSEGSGEAEISVYAMDTVMNLKAYGSNAESALREAEREILRLDSQLKRGSENSEVYKINSGGAAEISEDTAEIVSRALEISRLTGGAFDISIAPIMDLWGFYGNNFRVPAAEEIGMTLPLVGYENISVDGCAVSVKNEAKIDLGGIAKGFASDRIMEILRRNNIESGIISLGGNVQTLGEKPDGSKWRVAIQNPDGGAYIGTVGISDMAAVTSGGYQRFFERDGMVYHHIIDPKTGYPADSGVKSVTVFSSDGTLADGLSTALFVMGLNEGLEYWRNHGGFDAVFVTDDNKIYVTEGIESVFESEFDYEIIKREMIK